MLDYGGQAPREDVLPPRRSRVERCNRAGTPAVFRTICSQSLSLKRKDLTTPNVGELANNGPDVDTESLYARGARCRMARATRQLRTEDAKSGVCGEVSTDPLRGGHIRLRQDSSRTRAGWREKGNLKIEYGGREWLRKKTQDSRLHKLMAARMGHAASACVVSLISQ
jgi:hypothetical protein